MKTNGEFNYGRVRESTCPFIFVFINFFTILKSFLYYLYASNHFLQIL